MWLIVGLGNPGKEHEGQRHNAGFICIDEIARRYSNSNFTDKFSGQINDIRVDGQKHLLLKPMTYMNLSGQSVGEAARYYNINPENILVIHDDLDLPLNKIRIKQNGGHGGHNGLRDIDKHVGKNYWRLRLGIDHPGDKSKVHSYVLSNFTKTEQPQAERLSDLISYHLPIFFAQDHEAFMSKIAIELQE